MFKFTLSIIFTILVTNLYAQFKVTGKITDHTGKPLSLAIITLQQPGVKTSGAVSDSSGYYQISNLKTGWSLTTFELCSLPGHHHKVCATGVIIYINDKKKVLSGFNKSGRPRTLVYPLVITLASAASSIKTVSNKVIS